MNNVRLFQQGIIKQVSVSDPLAYQIHNITPAIHQRSAYQTMGWYDIYLPKQHNQNHFRCFQLCKNVCFTKSYYHSEQPLLSKIDYQSDTTLMVFGINGQSQLGFSANNQPYCINAGEIWLFNLRHQPLFRFSSAHIKHEMAVLKIPTRRLKQAFSEQDNKFNCIFDSPVTQIAVQQANEEWIAPLLENPLHTPFDRIKAEGRTLELFAHWLHPLAQSLSLPSLLNNNHQQINAIEKARSILISELTSPPALNDLARQVGMSHTRLNRDFKKAYGKTVFSWLREYRLTLAKTYLKDKTHSITDIAFQCGFSSASHFTQTFRQQEGNTPVAYRNQHLSQGTLDAY
ncbi:helix-turn-helix domain-containing protein [Photobacterium nomapromontoriensis]|uniref:helix-turn-helix domain-containing protein n=1 Tax=Photobacterium nomapromontoriensis TaxID=2910237 RepID=UPI003D0E1808